MKKGEETRVVRQRRRRGRDVERRGFYASPLYWIIRMLQRIALASIRRESIPVRVKGWERSMLEYGLIASIGPNTI